MASGNLRPLSAAGGSTTARPPSPFDDGDQWQGGAQHRGRGKRRVASVETMAGRCVVWDLCALPLPGSAARRHVLALPGFLPSMFPRPFLPPLQWRCASGCTAGAAAGQPARRRRRSGATKRAPPRSQPLCPAAHPPERPPGGVPTAQPSRGHCQRLRRLRLVARLRAARTPAVLHAAGGAGRCVRRGGWGGGGVGGPEMSGLGLLARLRGWARVRGRLQACTTRLLLDSCGPVRSSG